MCGVSILWKERQQIPNAGKGIVAAGGDTTAQRIVDKVQVAVIVEQYNNGSWSQV